MKQEEIEMYKKAGRIAAETAKYAKSIIKPGIKLVELADKIEAKTIELGGKPAFPINLSIDDVAAHNTPLHDDETLASGLLKVDLGVHVEGYIADLAFSLDLENNEENKKLILAAESALKKAIEIIKPGIEVWKIGEVIQKTIASHNLSPIRNLSGHSLDKYKVHAGITIPNYNNNNPTTLGKGAYAIEPFTTPGKGHVMSSSPPKPLIFSLKNKKVDIRLEQIEKKYGNLPFALRWLSEQSIPIAFKELMIFAKRGQINFYPPLKEQSNSLVAQAEHTILVTDNGGEITTRDH